MKYLINVDEEIIKCELCPLVYAGECSPECGLNNQSITYEEYAYKKPEWCKLIIFDKNSFRKIFNEAILEFEKEFFKNLIFGSGIGKPSGLIYGKSTEVFIADEEAFKKSNYRYKPGEINHLNSDHLKLKSNDDLVKDIKVKLNEKRNK